MLKNALLIVASVFVGALAAEGLARVAFPEWAPRSARLTNFSQYDQRLGWRYVPGVSGRFASYGFDTVVEINSKGFRGPERDYARNAGVRRVLVMGDSLTWGYGVDFEGTFTARLEKLVPNLEVVNLGVSGYSTDQELLLYQDEGRKYAADVVIVLVVKNDFGGNTRTVESIIYGKPMFVSRAGKLVLVNQPVARAPWWKEAAVRLSWRSYVLTEIHRALNRWDKRAGPPSAAASRKVARVPRKFPRSAGHAITVELLKAFKRVTAEDGSRLLVAFARSPVAREMSTYLAEFGIESIVLDEFLDPNDPTLYLYDTLHWTAKGHEVVAEALAERLTGILP